MADLYISGLTGTLDTGTIIDKLLQIKQQPITQLTQKKALTQAKVSSLSNLSGALNSIQSFLSNLNIDSIFKTKKATSSNTSVLTATASADTPNITMNLTVNKLAQTEMRASTLGLSSLTSTFSSSGTFTLKYWKSPTENVTYNINYSVGQTLQDLVKNINSSQNFVKASVYYTGTDYRLLLSEADAGASTKETDRTGSSFVIEAEALPAELGSLETLQDAQNASLTIGNSTNPVTSPSNTFKGILTGLDITVQSEGKATVTVSDDFSKIDSTLNEFASQYNGVINIVNQMTGKGAQFQGDSTITTIKTGFSNLIDPLIRAGLINYSDTNGTISINTSRLSELKASSPDSLRELLTNIKDSFSRQLNVYVSTVNSYKSTGESQINEIEGRISNLKTALVQYEERLRKEYAALEAFVSQMNQINSRIQDFIVTLSEMTRGGKK
ncbi:flagellar filament capping protein FliD [Thermodesulfovibrio sp. 1176]|uniref:flagellar filament capping protein FliD n=1 Tax=Thermodesulfovibrio sp. 1176 TaxID=3043424 RepID=UPI00248277FA|nr:flagellar filament capping protein FliD [Thermodesulfovibrio sp. 1176]MDI1471685.1 flagellar filament capping protein FliD [Thermodesulfovibrio sp. 1176]